MQGAVARQREVFFRNRRQGEAAQVVVHREDDKDHEEQEARRGKDPYHLAAVLHVHEEQDDQGGFADGDGHRKQNVAAGEWDMYVGCGDGRHHENDQPAEDRRVGLGLNDVISSHANASL